ncbi:MAG TPA: choice-of-anchor Q domain-containing protein [Candidatus Sulfotelmatobacter sp.]
MEGRTSSYIANNILAFNTAGPNKKHALNECCQLNTGSTNVYTHNLIYGNTDSIYFLDPASINDSPVNKEPQFIKYTGDETGDYRLQSGSPAKSAGTAAQAPRTDYAGSPRAPREGACDIGAYEDR